MYKATKCVITTQHTLYVGFVSHPHFTKFSLKSEVDIQNCRLHVKRHKKIL